MKAGFLSALFAALFLPGCVIVQSGVTNPIPGLTTVAVAPFINLSAERAVDGRRFALTYVSELQKVPGFQVLPVGVTEIAMLDNKVDLNDVDEVLKLAKVLRVDAVVVGAVTEYSPYYPPKIGMQVNWYSPRAWAFYPGIQTEPAARAQLKDWDKQRLQEWREYQRQKDEECAPETPVWERMYRCFKRWPGVRNLYGEPTLAWSPVDGRFGNGTALIYRGQAPPAAEGPALLPEPPPKRELSPPVADDGVEAVPVKVAHYQQIEGMPEVIRQVIQEDAGTKMSKPADGPANGPTAPDPGSDKKPAAPAAPTPNAAAIDGPVPPVPDSGLNNPLPGGADLVPSAPPETQVAPPFSDNFEKGRVTPTPAVPLPLGAEPPPLTETSPRMGAIRDPKLAPPLPQPNPFNTAQPIQPWQLDPHLPLMSYTRLFDGADGELVAALRDYVELNGDLRSGGWEAYLHRSDDFIRFTSYRMILEMLSLHGGEGKHRMVFKFRKYK